MQDQSAMNAMKRIQRVPDLRSQIYDRLRSAIRSGVYPPGTRLVENDVARDLGVSRTPAREALALLTRDGMLIREDRCFKLPNFDAQQITEVFEIRRGLEPYAVRLACERASPAERKALRASAHEAFDQSLTLEGYVEMNLKFRQALFSLCKNKRMEEAIHLYDELVHYVRIKTLNLEENRALSVKGWRKLITAFAAGKADVAEEEMRQLLDLAHQLVLDTVQQDATGAGTTEG
jgi:DNA-binding GntR family transcriptional regulator